MARDANGNYILPLPDVLGGQPILADWANETMNDLGDEMTDSLSRTGKGGMLTALTFVNGSAFAPGIAWTSETDMGFYRAGPSDQRVSVGNIDSMRWTPAGVDIWDGSEFQPVVFGDLAAEFVSYNIANQNLITSEDVQGALDQISLGLEGAISGINIRGTWDASTGNPPDFEVNPAEGGDLWVVIVAGQTGLPPAGGGNDLVNWQVGERPVFIAGADPQGWIRLPAISGIVANEVLFNSVNFDNEFPSEPSPTEVQSALDFSWPYIRQVFDGFQATQIEFIPVDDITSTNVQTAIAEVNSKIEEGGVTEDGDNTFTGANTFTQNILMTEPQGILDANLTRREYVLGLTNPLDGRVTINEADIATNIGDISSLDGRVGVNESGISGLDTRVTTNEGDITQIESDIAALDASSIEFIDVPSPPDPPAHINVQTGLAAALEAEGTRFDPSGSALLDINVQDAIDTLALFLQSLVSGLIFEGSWDALADDPEIGIEADTSGQFWIVSVAGTTPLTAWDGGPDLDNWVIGDRAIYLDNAGGTGFFQLPSNTVLPANQITFDSFTFDQFLPNQPSPDDVQEALDTLWEPISILGEGGVIRAPDLLGTTDLNTLGNPTDAVGWYYQDTTGNTPGNNYPGTGSAGSLRIVQVASSGVAQHYVTNNEPPQNWTRRSLNNGALPADWSEWVQESTTDDLDTHAALVDGAVFHLNALAQTIVGAKTFSTACVFTAPLTVGLNTADTHAARQAYVIQQNALNVQLAGTQSITGAKTFTVACTFNAPLVVGLNTLDTHAARQSYVLDQVVLRALVGGNPALAFNALAGTTGTQVTNAAQALAHANLRPTQTIAGHPKMWLTDTDTLNIDTSL